MQLMKRTLKQTLAAVTLVLIGVTIGLPNAEAGRVGSGKSVGKQSSNVSQRRAEPQKAQAAQATPAQPNAAAQPARNRWLGPIAGLAAGLGLAALASHFGFGEELANGLMIGMLVLAALALFGYFMRRKAANMKPAFNGPSNLHGTANQVEQNMAYQAQPLAGGNANQEAFDEAGFLGHAKRYFTRLQASYDKADYDDLREFTTPEMFTVLYAEIQQRNGAANQTDVVQLNAEFGGLEKFGGEHTASVLFSGLIREAAGAPANAFAEIWHFTRPVQGDAGWVLAGIQQHEAASA